MLSTRTAHAEDKKPDPAKVLPQIIMTMPLAVTRGSTAKLIVRGKGLAEAKEVKADAGDTSLKVTIKSKGKADVPKPELTEKMGDTQVEIEVEVAAEVSGDEIKVVVVAPNGTSESHIVRVYNAADLTPEKEPNGGFQTAQEINASTTIVGSIDKENDVDVYRISGKSGQKISAEIIAARLGSSLDSLITLYDDHGRVVAMNDDGDSGTTDSKLTIALPHDGTFYVGVTDALGNGGAMFPYLLRLTLE